MTDSECMIFCILWFAFGIYFGRNIMAPRLPPVCGKFEASAPTESPDEKSGGK